MFWKLYETAEKLLRKVAKDERGQDMVEYGLLLGIIAVGAVTAVGQIATKVTGYFTTLSAALP
jgi:pilus assembly protein Flp/PilA